MRLRLLAAVLAATSALAAPANAWGGDQVRDPKGDVRGGLASLDILNARWSTTGRGKTKALVATMTLAAPAEDGAPFVYQLKSEVRGCGTVQFDYTPGHLLSYADMLHQPAISDGPITSSVWLECGGDASSPTTGSTLIHREVTFTAKGNTISWSVPLSVLPKQVGIGSVFSDFSAAADAGEPSMGQSLTALMGQSLDYGTGDGTWRLK